MILDNSEHELSRLRASTKPIVAWKVVKPNGHPLLFDTRCGYQCPSYGPGVSAARHMTKDYRYDEGKCCVRGLYVYRTKSQAKHGRLHPENIRIVKVNIDPKDLLAASEQMLVTRRIRISPEDWVSARLPGREKRRRYI